MAITKLHDGCCFVPIRSGQSCPVCGSKKGRCAEFYNEQGVKVFYRCRYAEGGKPSNGWYIHLVKDIDGYDPAEKPVVRVNLPEKEEVTQEDLILRDKVYRRFRELVKFYEGSYLYESDKQDLINRGLTEKEIEHMGFFSVPTRGDKVQAEDGKYQIRTSTAIARALYSEFGNKLLKVPGFVKRTDKKGNDVVAFKIATRDQSEGKFVPIKGYFIPYVSLEGLILGLQYRLTKSVLDSKGKELRYFWYSSVQARSGSPIDCYSPTRNNDRMAHIRLVTEGATKGKIASEKMGCKGFYMAGVSNYRALLESIQAQERLDSEVYNIILAFDMDKSENEEVLKAEATTVQMLKETGHQVAIASWDGRKAKGIDDALVMGLKISYKLI